MQGETTTIRIAENEGKLDVIPQNRSQSSGRASAKSWQYRWVALYPANAQHLSEFTHVNRVFLSH